MLHRTDRQLFQPLRLNMIPFGVIALNQRNLVNTKFYNFFNEPLETVRILDRRDGNVNSKASDRLCYFFLDLEGTLKAVWFGDDGMVKETLTICDMNGVTILFPKYLCTMLRFERVEVVYPLRK